MAAGVKTAGFVALARVFVVIFDAPGWEDFPVQWKDVFFWLAVASMCTGNILALVQSNVKRMLAYSSVAHAGYLLIAVMAVSSSGDSSNVGSGLFIYLLGYSAATTGAFAIVAKLGRNMEEDITYSHFNGFAYSSGLAAFCMTLFMCSLAGFPPLAGFIGKYVVFREALLSDETLLPLIIIAVLNSVASAYYYLKLVVHMYMREADEERATINSAPMTWAYLLSALLVIIVGTLPDRYLGWSDRASNATHPVTAIENIVEEDTTPIPVEPQQQVQAP